jgi:cell division protein DivIC
VTIKRLSYFAFILLLLGLGFMGFVSFKEARVEYVHLKQIQERDKRRLEAAQKQLEREQVMLKRLKTDPAFVEQQIRMKLGYTKPDEMIFRFEQ